jgi:hypothetical protein
MYREKTMKWYEMLALGATALVTYACGPAANEDYSEPDTSNDPDVVSYETADTLEESVRPDLHAEGGLEVAVADSVDPKENYQGDATHEGVGYETETQPEVDNYETAVSGPDATLCNPENADPETGDCYPLDLQSGEFYCIDVGQDVGPSCADSSIIPPGFPTFTGPRPGNPGVSMYWIYWDDEGYDLGSGEANSSGVFYHTFDNDGTMYLKVQDAEGNFSDTAAVDYSVD